MTKRKVSRRGTSEDWMARIRESSHDVVLAGLASLTRAHGSDATGAPADFKTLVAEGRRLEPELHEMARKAWSEWVTKPSKLMALQPQGKLQSVFDERVISALVRLGVPSGEEMADLRAKVDHLLAREGLTSRPAPRDEARERARVRAAPRQRRGPSRPVDGQTPRRRPARG